MTFTICGLEVLHILIFASIQIGPCWCSRTKPCQTDIREISSCTRAICEYGQWPVVICGWVMMWQIALCHPANIRSCKRFLRHAVWSGCHPSANVTSCPSAILIQSVHLLLQLVCSEEFAHQNLVCISRHTPSPCCPVTSGSSGAFTSKPTPGARVRLVQ